MESSYEKIDDTNTTQVHHRALHTEISVLQQQVKGLREYARHKESCPRNRYENATYCLCGFEAALSASIPVGEETIWAKGEAESRQELARGEGIRFKSGKDVVKWLGQPETPVDAYSVGINEGAAGINKRSVTQTVCRCVEGKGKVLRGEGLNGRICPTCWVSPEHSPECTTPGCGGSGTLNPRGDG